MLPLHNVQQYDRNESARAQITYVRDGHSVTCTHFFGPTMPPDALTVLRDIPPPPGAVELDVASALPEVGQQVQLIWDQRGFRSVIDARVARVEATSFAVFIGMCPPESLRGLSGSLCWAGDRALGIATGCQRDLGHAYMWVTPIELSQETLQT